MLIACMYKSSSSEESNLKCLNEMIMQASSISARTKSYLRRIQRIWPLRMLEWKWRHRKSRARKGHNRKWRHNRKYVLCMPGSAFPRFFLLTIVVQNVSLRMTDRTTGSPVTPKEVPLGVRMRNRKLRNIRPSGAFWLEVTLWNVTRSDRRSRDPVLLTRSHVIGSALGVLSRAEASYK